MAWLPNKKLVVPYQEQHCVQEFNTTTGSSNTLIGKLDMQGSQFTGHRLHDVLLKLPFGVAVVDSLVYITLNRDKKILKLNLEDDIVSVLADFDLHLRYLSFDPISSSLTFSFTHGVGRISTMCKPYKMEKIAGSERLDAGDGTLTNTGFQWPRQVKELPGEELLINDLQNQRLARISIHC